MRIVFMGTPYYAVRILDEIVKSNIEVLAIFTQSDKPVGRKQVLSPSDVKRYAIDNHLESIVFTPKKLKDSGVAEQISALKPDFIVVAAYGKILPKSILDIAPCINLHASILPKYRGASPIQSAILSGEKQTGVTAMLMSEGLDEGDMLDFAFTDCLSKTSDQLFDELAEMASKLIIKVLRNYHAITPIKQDENLASYCTKITKNMGQFSFELSADEIYRKFLAFSSWPTIFLGNGTKFLDIKKSGLSGKSGVILSINKDSFVVGCGCDSIEVFMVQEPSKKAISGFNYINGKRLKVGDRIC